MEHSGDTGTNPSSADGAIRIVVTFGDSWSYENNNGGDDGVAATLEHGCASLAIIGVCLLLPAAAVTISQVNTGRINSRPPAAANGDPMASDAATSSGIWTIGLG